MRGMGTMRFEREEPCVGEMLSGLSRRRVCSESSPLRAHRGDHELDQIEEGDYVHLMPIAHLHKDQSVDCARVKRARHKMAHECCED